MKKKEFLWSIQAIMMATMLSVGVISCGGDDEDDTVSVSMTSLSFGESGGSQSIQVMSNTSWTVSGAPDWLTIAPSQGSGTSAFLVNASANTDKNGRNCALVVSAGNATPITITVNQSGKVPDTRVTIINNSTYTLERFRVVFLNSRLESLTDRDFGTLSPGTSVTADIPTSATQFYMATYLNSRWYFSPNYDIEFTYLNLTTAEVGNWSANASAKMGQTIPTP